MDTSSGTTEHWSQYSARPITVEVSHFCLPSPALSQPKYAEFDNYGACMRFESLVLSAFFTSFLTVWNSVSEELLCAFELLKPLDGPALRKEMTKAKRKR